MPVGWLASRGATSQFNHREEFVFDISSIRYQLGSLPGWDRAAGSHPRLGGPVSSPLSYTSKKCENVAGQDWSSHHTSHSYCLSCKRNTFTPRQTCPCYNSLWLGLRTWRQGEVIPSHSHAVCVQIVGRCQLGLLIPPSSSSLHGTRTLLNTLLVVTSYKMLRRV